MLDTRMKTLSLLSGVALICVASISAAAAGVVRADINVRGNVSVNDQAAVSNSTVVSGSTITTGSDAGAVIGISKNGRIELMPGTSVTLKYDDTSINAVLLSGEIRVGDADGIATTVTTPDAVFTADPGRSNTFAINTSGGGNLTYGKLTVVSAKTPVNIAVRNGRVVSLVSGESVVQDDDDDDDDNGGGLWIGLGVAGGLTALAIYFIRKDDVMLVTPPVSPFR